MYPSSLSLIPFSYDNFQKKMNLHDFFGTLSTSRFLRCGLSISFLMFILDSGMEYGTQPIVDKCKCDQDLKPNCLPKLYLIVTLYMTLHLLLWSLHWIELRKKNDVECVLQTHDSTWKFTSLSDSWSIKEKDLGTDLEMSKWEITTKVLEEKKCTKGIGIMTSATQPKRVLAHLKSKALNICVVNNGKAVPDKFPGQARRRLNLKPGNRGRKINLLARLWPAKADDANGP